MLILKSNADLPISIRNVGHSIGEALKRMQMTFAVEMHLTEEVTNQVESHLYEMSAIGKNIHALGKEETFDINKIYARLEFYQSDYSKHANDLLTLVTKSTEDFEEVAAMMINESNRIFTDEIQMSSVNRLEELQNLLETTAISSISGLLRLDWSAVSFIHHFRSTLYNTEHETLLQSIRDHFAEKLTSNEEFDLDEEFDKSIKTANDKLIEFTKSTVSENVSEVMINKYNELFVANEDLEILKSKAIEVAMNCLTRGAAKKMIIEEFVAKVETFKIEFVKLVEMLKSDSKLSEEKIVELLTELMDGAVFNYEILKEEKSISILYLPVSAQLNLEEIDTVFFGSTEIELSVDTSNKSVTVVKDVVELSEAVTRDGEIIGESDLLQIQSDLEEEIKSRVEILKSNILEVLK